ncbi:MAG: NADH-quinone oxidoreductase subunit M [Cyanobacteria bacterium]|nr:NADH-quinone oxidoreductase subunit M [Cyanobacteriota bacterium]
MDTLLKIDYYSALIFAPLILAVMIPFIKPNDKNANIHFIAFVDSLFLFIFSLLPWLPGFYEVAGVTIPWFPSIGINYAVGSDGLTWTLVVLTTFLFLMAILASKSSIHNRVKFYYSMLFVLMTSILGVFIARDLFLYFLFWELELIPMYFLIAIWGGPNRDYAAVKFVLYTLFGSVFLVAGLLAIYYYGNKFGIDPSKMLLYDTVSTDYVKLIPIAAQTLIFMAFFITFAVKLPMVPFHTWLPDAHVEAPTPVSMLLAGILLKMGSYGMMRLCFGFFPEAAKFWAPILVALAFINIVYTAGVALVQKDLKKLVAYSSVSHMGFVLLGLAAMNQAGYNGAVFVMLSHGIVSAALFMCVGTLYLRTHTRLISEYGGFATQTPIIFYFFMFMCMASLGLPLLISFPGETMVFYGAFLSKIQSLAVLNVGPLTLDFSIQSFTILSGLGVIIGAAYLLWMLQRVFFGPLSEKWTKLHDATRSEVFVLSILAIIVLAYGLAPQLLINKYQKSVTQLYNRTLEKHVYTSGVTPPAAVTTVSNTHVSNSHSLPASGPNISLVSQEGVR